MSYIPDFAAVYRDVTSNQVGNHTFTGKDTDPLIRAQQVLDTEFSEIRSTFSGTYNGRTSRPKNQSESEAQAKSDAYVKLFRYLSAVYSLTESIELLIEQASNKNHVDIRPPFNSVGKWNGKRGNLQASGITDEVLRPFLYLVGLRHVVTHATLNSFSIICDTDSQGIEQVIIQFSPSDADADPAVEGVTDASGTQRCFTDSYLRYEKNLNKVTHPIDYIYDNHTTFILPFINDMMNYI